MGRLVCFDYGRARIGISVSDERKIIASPFQLFKVPKTKQALLKELQILLAPLFPIDRFIVGLPLLFSGKEGDMAFEAKAFGEAISTHFSIPCVFWDERLTSSQADKLMKEASLSRKQRSTLVDNLASTIILQTYMDTLS